MVGATANEGAFLHINQGARQHVESGVIDDVPFQGASTCFGEGARPSQDGAAVIQHDACGGVEIQRGACCNSKLRGSILLRRGACGCCCTQREGACVDRGCACVRVGPRQNRFTHTRLGQGSRARNHSADSEIARSIAVKDQRSVIGH